MDISSQGGVGGSRGIRRGPTGLVLWNLFYDRLLRIQLLAGTRLVGFPDDVVILITKHMTEELEKTAHDACMDRYGLELAPEKTETVILTGNGRLYLPGQ